MISIMRLFHVWNSEKCAQYCGELFKGKIPCSTSTYYKHTKLRKEYKNDVEVRCAKIQSGVEQYRKNEDYREKVKSDSKLKYSENQDFRSDVKSHSKLKYLKNVDIRLNVKSRSKLKYSENQEFVKK